MADKLRTVNTKFWNDTFIEELSPSEKLLFLYLLTNPQTNLIGIYEISIKRIAYDTGLNADMVRKGLERFETLKKAFYVDSYIVLPNFLKNQNLNSNMKIAVLRQFKELPNSLKESILGNHSESLRNHSESFEIILESLDKYEIEIESETEIEIEPETGPSWRIDYECYKTDLRKAYLELTEDKNFIAEQERFYPGVDIKLSIEKACVNFWSKEAGWKHKKKQKSKTIDWKQTFINAIDLNKVYKPRNAEPETVTTYKPK